MWIIIFDAVLLVVVIAGWIFVRMRPRRLAKIVGNQDFNAQIAAHAQLVDVRDPSEFRRKHILGARNLPSVQFKSSMGALTKQKPVLLYENSRPQRSLGVAKSLKKAGYKEIYILQEGLNKWGGKVKEG